MSSALKVRCIIHAIVFEFDISHEEFRKKAERRSIQPRMIAVWLIRKYVGISYRDISRVIGVSYDGIYGLNAKCESRYEYSPKFRLLRDRIEANVLAKVPMNEAMKNYYVWNAELHTWDISKRLLQEAGGFEICIA